MNKKFDLLNDFCNKMNASLPEARIIDDYFRIIKSYSEKIIEQTFQEWRNDNAFKFPSPNDLQIKLIEVNSRENRKGGPQTIQDLFGNKVRVETPLAREFRRILKAFLGYPVYRNGHVFRTGVITRQEMTEMAEEAEAKYGIARGEDVPVNIAKGYRIDWS